MWFLWSRHVKSVIDGKQPHTITLPPFLITAIIRNLQVRLQFILTNVQISAVIIQYIYEAPLCYFLSTVAFSLSKHDMGGYSVDHGLNFTEYILNALNIDANEAFLKNNKST